jgi:hypothetical protein
MEYRDCSNVPVEFSQLGDFQHPVTKTTQRYVLGDRFHASTNPHKSPLCEYHNINLCLQSNSLKTSIQESQNHRKNKTRLRSSCLQTFEQHVFFNFLMDYYQNEEVVMMQKRNLTKAGITFVRDDLLRFSIVRA